jgi:predicted RecA/RadA family phage recombinase
MAIAQFIHDDDYINYTPGSAVTAGDVIVQGDLIGVAKGDIAANKLGALAVEGVFDFPKASGASTAIAAGATVYWDAADQQVKTDSNSGANKLLGKSVAAAGDSATTVRVRMIQ